jgi:galactofuranosylgalactofuranosylrhamnosyl-N-acetylglucosaminyl-diphospho-decaprenol beta-1,5/1,6-galactofuranosyltransferase
MPTLQNLLLPEIDLCTSGDMYVRTKRGAFWTIHDRTVQFGRGAVASFDTYFNAFPVAKWQQYTTVPEVSFELDLAGRFEAQAVFDHPYRARRIVAADVVEGEGGTATFGPLALDTLVGGQLFLRLRCLGANGALHGMRVVTPAAPTHDVRLTIVMTTFRRPGYVQANVDRLLAYFAGAPELAANVRVLIVDNGRDLEVDLPPAAPVRVVPNANLGGAGGFARGLMEVRQAGWATHVLFMDDDVSFHPEVIGRTMGLLAYAASPQLCVSGAMLREEQPQLQHEAAAGWDPFAVHPWRPIGKDVDLSEEENLPQNDLDFPIDYSGWWYFAFPVSLTADNPLPVFVRGDDVLFSLLHARPHAITANGIGVWHQDFEYKNGPSAFYYEARNIALVNTIAIEGYQAKHLRKRFLALTMRALLSMKYDSAEATIRGVHDFLRGPEWWSEIDHEAINSASREHQGERLGELPEHFRRMPLWQPRPLPFQQVSILLSLVTLGGHLLPASRTRQGPAAVSLQTRPITTGLWRDEIVYRYPPSGEGFVVRRDRERFFALLKETARTCVEISRRFDGVRDRYRAAYPGMVSDENWRRLLATPKAKGGNVPAQGLSA